MRSLNLRIGLIGILIAASIGLGFYLSLKYCTPAPLAPTAFKDSVIFWKNKYNQEVSRNDVLIGNVLQINQFLYQQYHVNDSLKELLKADKNTSAAAYVSNITSGNATGIRNDSVIIKDTVYVAQRNALPYGYIYHSKWLNYNATAYPDSLQLTYSIYNEYVAKTHWQKGFLKKPIFTLDITNLNPNTKTKEQFAYKVTAPPKRLGLGIIGGVGIGARPGYFIGVGLSYDLIQF